MGDVTLNSAAVVAVAGLLAALSGGLGVLFRSSRERERELTSAVIAAKDAQIARQTAMNDKLADAIAANVTALQHMIESLSALEEERLAREERLMSEKHGRTSSSVNR